MAHAVNPIASHHLPFFVTAPGGTDVLMVIMALVLLVAILGFGVLFLRLHTLPERIAHTSKKIQFEIVAILGLIALFTHMHIFWIAGLLLALIDLPDFGHDLKRIAGSAEKIAGYKPGEGADDAPAASLVPHEDVAALAEAEGQHADTNSSQAAKVAPARRDLSHA